MMEIAPWTLLFPRRVPGDHAASASTSSATACATRSIRRIAERHDRAARQSQRSRGRDLRSARTPDGEVARGQRASGSRSPRARRSASSANPAPARARSFMAVMGLLAQQRPRQPAACRFRRRGDPRTSRRPRSTGCAARGIVDDLPGPDDLAQPVPHGRAGR